MLGNWSFHRICSVLQRELCEFSMCPLAVQYQVELRIRVSAPLVTHRRYSKASRLRLAITPTWVLVHLVPPLVRVCFHGARGQSQLRVSFSSLMASALLL